MKTLLLNRILPILLVVCVMATGLAVPMPVSAAIPPQALKYLIGGGIIILESIFNVLVNGVPNMGFDELADAAELAALERQWESDWINGLYTKYVVVDDNGNYNIAADHSDLPALDLYILTILISGLNEGMRGIVQAQILDDIRYEDNGVTFSNEIYRLLTESGAKACVINAAKNTGALPPVISADTKGNLTATITASVPTFNTGGFGKNIHLLELNQNISLEKIANEIAKIGEWSYMNGFELCPMLISEDNRELYILNYNRTAYGSDSDRGGSYGGHSLIFDYYDSSYGWRFILSTYYNEYYSAGLRSSYNGNLGGYHTWTEGAKGLIVSYSFGAFNFEFAKGKYVSIKHSYTNINDIVTGSFGQFFASKSYDYSQLGNVRPYIAVVEKGYIWEYLKYINDNNIDAWEGVSTPTKVVTLPKTKTEDLIDRGISANILPKNPDITVSNTGAVSVAGVDTAVLAKTVEKEKPYEGENKFEIDMPTVFDKFPFSLPFDLYNIITLLDVPPETPKFVIPLSNKTQGDYQIGSKWYTKEGKEKLFLFDFSIDIDLEGFGLLSVICRSLFEVIFVIGLIKITNKIIGR